MNREKERMNLKHACCSIEREMSSGHFVRMYMFRIILTNDVRMVARSRRERMVAHDFTDTPFLLPLETCRKDAL